MPVLISRKCCIRVDRTNEIMHYLRIEKNDLKNQINQIDNSNENSD